LARRVCGLFGEKYTGQPIAIDEWTGGGDMRQVSGKHLWAMKRKQQRRDQEAAARGEQSGEDVLLLRPSRIVGATVKWPEGSLRDEPVPRAASGQRAGSSQNRRKSAKVRARRDIP
jgi:hypothetical protein